MNNKGEPKIEKRGFNFEDTCKYIGGVRRATLYAIIAKCELQSYMIGKRRYFTREHLDAFIDKAHGKGEVKG